MTYYEWKDKFFGNRKMFDKNPQPTMPARMKVVSATTGFVTGSSPRGECFEWYQLINGAWKATDILQGENWKLEQPKVSLQQE